MKKKTCLSFLFFFLFNITNIYASGFAVFSQGASSFGKAGASIAYSDSPSSVFYNPALISSLDGTQIETGTTVINLEFEHKSDLTGKTDSTDNSIFFPSTLYATYNFNKKLSFGFGAFSPFGLATQWDKTWEGRYLATNSELTSLCANPVVSWQATPKLAIAGGVNILYIDATLENSINLSPMGLGDARQKFKGDDYGYGFNLGLLYQFTDQIQAGMSFRSGYSMDLDGRLSFDLPMGSPDLLAGALPDTGSRAAIDLPEKFFASIAFQATPKLVVEAGILREGWSCYDKITTRSEKPVNGVTAEIIDKDWNDTMTYNLGLEYCFNDRLTLRTGYLFRENAVPDHTFDPSLPDSDASLYAFGGDFAWNQYTLSMAYVYERQNDRNKDTALGFIKGSSANGEYSSDIHFVAVSLKIKL
ncbi:MAG: outer membrane protein transport protein [Desulfobacteraceae bacterium]